MTRKSRTLSYPGSITVALLTAAALTACGGGGDGGSQSAQQPTTTPSSGTPAAKPASVLTPACNGCGAIDANTYAGSGVGVWQNINATAAAVDMPISIDGLKGQDVTLVFTNQTGVPQTMPNISLTASYMPNVAASQLRWDDGTEAIKRRISDFNRDGWAALAGTKGSKPSYSMVSPPNLSVVNDVKNWYHEDRSLRSATLVRKQTTSDGTVINFWVESAELPRVTSAILDSLENSFVPAGKTYDMLKSVGGPVWGPHTYTDLIPGTPAQPIDIVIMNFDRNGSPFGMVGYFYGLNAIKKDPMYPDTLYSNESVSLYLDSETLYLGGAEGMQAMLLTMAHEGMHMQNFYRRGVLKGDTYMFDTWLEEASAMMMEDFASHSIDPNYNAIRDVRFPDYIGYKAGSYNCGLLNWTPFDTACDSYSVSGSLGGFLDRQLGLGFYKNLLTNFSSTDSMTVLDSAIRSVSPTSSLGEQMRRFAATSGSLMKTPSPTGFGFPALTATPFVLPPIDPQAQLSRRTLTQSIPATLQPYASLPVVRKAVNGTYSETVKVPAGTTLSVVIQ